ncbi:type I restriction enzyme S subunit [Yokenella regensburgei]|uniref:Type I restriction enzyme S subunit n=1 Tax=Yokenella regensburgei TaxID=158877 RepID=A0ABX9RVJ5_9ENTR|nr:restriction endonuclease subunit S [Yokenella regensburgei]RKR53931.1 type I restriction enzyme S subunit [Yokenella regensburgei]VFS23947.1 Type I restriction enzyme EcoKI specificity protein [Yokenella regensburgei]
MAKYKAYPEYKDSGVEFLGRVPTEWSVNSLKNIALIVNGSTPKSGVEEYWDGDINWITPTDLSQKSGVYLNDSQRKITNEGLNSCGTSLVPENTVILSTRAPIGSLAITGVQSCTNQGCKSLVVTNKESSLFLYYFLSISTSPLNNLGRGSTFLELSTEDLASFKVPMPNVGIGTIVSFLDHETAKIDALIEKQRQLIELLKEKRQAVISHAVTKGLNPDVPMKDSGVEWLGEVPEHWTVTRLGNHAIKIGSGKTPRGGSEIYLDEGVLFLRSQNIYDDGLRVGPSECVFIDIKTHNEMKGTHVLEGDILLNITGGSIGRSCIVPAPFVEANVNQHVCILRFTENIRDFISYAMKSSSTKEQIEACQVGGNREGLNFEQTSKINICLPPEEEIGAVLGYLKIRLPQLDILEKNAENIILLLQERRTALISAAVTGKIDVRDWVAPDAQDIAASQEATA